jgi:hypothetical protein
MMIGLIAVQPSFAFSSMTASEVLTYLLTGKPGGYIHRQISEVGLDRLNLKREVIDRVGERQFLIDWDESEKWLPPNPNRNYAPEHHFDRNRLATCEGCQSRHSEAFARGAKYLREQKMIAIAALKKECDAGREEAIEAIARGLHALQDAISHSNIVDLPPADLAAVKAAMMNATAPPPALKMAGYDLAKGIDLEKTPDNECDPSRDFGHDACSKDEPEKNEEARRKIDPTSGAYETLFPNRTKFDAAYALAIEFTADWTGGIRREVGDESWEKLVNKNAAENAQMCLASLAILMPAPVNNQIQIRRDRSPDQIFSFR